MISFREIDKNKDVFLIKSIRDQHLKWLHNSTSFSLNNTRKWIDTLEIPYYIVSSNNVDIGYFRLSQYSNLNQSLYIGMDLDEKYIGKGWAFKSYCLFIPYIFKLYSLKKIYLEVLSTNERAIKLYEKLGFVTEKIKCREIYRDGIYIDSIVMLLKESKIKMLDIYDDI